MGNQKYKVVIGKKILKTLQKLPQKTAYRFGLLVDDIEEFGPIRKNWNNFSSLGKNSYHCHLSYHWVACWRCEEKSIEIEVYYVGSREKAPY